MCVSATVDSSKLPAYSPSQVYGDGGVTISGAPTSCFDVQGCFQAAAPVANLDPGTCSFPLTSGMTASTLNLALATSTTGACVPSGPCYVPLVSDPSEGWTVQGSTVTLPPGVCAKLGNGVTLVSSGMCPAETPSEPVCEPVGADAGEPPADSSTPPDVSTDAAVSEVGVDASGPPTDATLQPDVPGADAEVDSAADAALLDEGVDAFVASDATGDGAPVDAMTSEAGGCDAGFTVCNAVCVDTSSDPVNCGACGSVCNGTCTYGGCMTTIFTADNRTEALVVDSTNLYWTDYGEGAVMKAPLAGGASTTLASGQIFQGFPGDYGTLAVDATNVYWTSALAVMSVPISGGSATTLYGSGGGAIAADGMNVYWTSGSEI